MLSDSLSSVGLGDASAASSASSVPVEMGGISSAPLGRSVEFNESVNTIHTFDQMLSPAVNTSNGGGRDDGSSSSSATTNSNGRSGDGGAALPGDAGKASSFRVDSVLDLTEEEEAFEEQRRRAAARAQKAAAKAEKRRQWEEESSVLYARRGRCTCTDRCTRRSRADSR